METFPSFGAAVSTSTGRSIIYNGFKDLRSPHPQRFSDIPKLNLTMPQWPDGGIDSVTHHVYDQRCDCAFFLCFKRFSDSSPFRCPRNSPFSASSEYIVRTSRPVCDALMPPL
jgi:hypothetical protein